jgi:hypothetical protein
MLDLSFEVEGASVREARQLVPDVLRAARAPQGPIPAAAIVTHTAPEVLPLACGRLTGASDAVHPQTRNLFGAGLWLMGDREAQAMADALLSAGHQAGQAAARQAPAVCLGAAPLAGTLVEPVRQTCDVLVAGGGTGGALAALAAARRGCSTLVLKAGTCLGGIGTAGGIHSYYYGIQGGLQDEVDDRTAELAPLFGPAMRSRQFQDRKSTRLNSSHNPASRMPSSA